MYLFCNNRWTYLQSNFGNQDAVNLFTVLLFLQCFYFYFSLNWLFMCIFVELLKTTRAWSLKSAGEDTQQNTPRTLKIRSAHTWKVPHLQGWVPVLWRVNGALLFLESTCRDRKHFITHLIWGFIGHSILVHSKNTVHCIDKSPSTLYLFIPLGK